MKTAFRLIMILVLSVVLAVVIMVPPRSEARGAIWTVYVYGNPNLVDPPLYTGVSSAINYNWGMGAPVINGVDTSAYGVPADRFSVRFTSSVFFTAGSYQFTLQVDDGARLYIDGGILINQWMEGSLRTFQATYSFATDGNHTVTVEMFDSLYDAAILVNWALVGPPGPTPGGGGTGTGTGQPWYAEFFGNTEWSGVPVFTASYPPSGLNLNWGEGSPGGAVPVDYFSARLTRTLNVPAEMPSGVYTFYAQADDNFRFWVDATLIMDHSGEYANSQVYTADVTLLDGPHIFKFEYRELTEGASLFLTWSPPNGQNPPLAPPTGAVVPTPIPGEGTGGGGAPPPVPTGIRGRVMGNLRIRQQPTTASPKIGLMPWGTEVDLIGINGARNWYMLNYNGTVGWSYAPWIWIIQGDANNLPITDGSLSEFPPPNAMQGVIVQAYGNVRIRIGPGLQYPRIDRVIWGSRVQLLARSANGLWYKIKYGDVIGWSYALWYRAVQGDPLSVPVEG
jgi:uncharacterized protein YraI/uncharacterized protein YndB with AHSA1/START domain